MINQKLQQLQNAFKNLKEKILTKINSAQETITQTTDKLNDSNKKLELQTKENFDNEQVLEQLLTDFKELQTALE